MAAPAPVRPAIICWEIPAGLSTAVQPFQMLIDDAIIEVNQQGHIIWEWELNKHFSEMGYDNISTAAIIKNKNISSSR